MFGTETGTATDYHELNAGAHRKPPKTLTAPALIWHLAFWTAASRRDTEGQETNPERISDMLDRFILALCCVITKKVGKVELDPNILGVHLLFKNVCHQGTFQPAKIDLNKRQQDIFTSTSRSVSLQFKWKKLDVSIVFEIQTEYFSISTFVELDMNSENAEGRRPYSDIDDLNRNIIRIVKFLNRPNSSNPAAKSPQLSDLKSMPPAQSPLSDHRPAVRSRDLSSSPAPGDDVPTQINQYCFHDFWKVYETDILSDASLADFTADEAFKQVFADFRGFIGSEQAVKFSDSDFFNQNKPPKWGQEAKAKFLPLIQHRDLVDQRPYECAVNYMLDGRAFYMSTLGPQFPSMPDERRIPVEFIVYANQRLPDDSETMVNKWQLGRLVNQILLLGTLRLCALKDVKLLQDAGRELGQLDQSTQAAREAIASNDDLAMKLIRDVHEKLNDITGKFLTKTRSGLLYRIERSRYYVKQFDENVKLLRIKRVEGDQPYDQFIKRRLGSEFDFIDRLGVRHERATQTIVTLDQNYLSMKANQIDEGIHTVQKYGEVLLLGVLVPYYVTHLFILILGEELSFPIAVVVWITFISATFIRSYKIWEKIRERFSLIGIVAFASMAGLLAGAYIIPPFKMLLLDIQQKRHEHKLAESVETQVGVLKKFLETQQPSRDSSKAAAPIHPVVPAAGSVGPPPLSGPTPRAPDAIAPANEPAGPNLNSRTPDKDGG